jgi:rod shape determining protein RodA
MSTLTPIQPAAGAIHAGEEPLARRRRALLAFDPLLLIAALGLIACSVVVLRGMSGTGSDYEKQAIFGVLGALLAVAVAAFDYTRLREFRYALYALLLAINLAVFVFPAPSDGATRHIPLPFIEPQPSEFGKLLLILTLAAFMVERSRRIHEHRTTARIMLLALAPAMVVILQPDLGTGLVYVTIGVAVLFFAGTGWKQLGALFTLFVVALVMALVVAPAAGVNVVHAYQKQRLMTFLNPPRVCNATKDPPCYQLQQALIAIGSGGKTGSGRTGATQVQFNFVPEAQDDFIFAVVGEEYGFVGAALVLSLYALLIWRTLRILTMSKNLFGTLIAGGVLAMFMFQVFVNVGMAIGIMPVTGVPLPLLSYGGSSVITSFLALGLLESIYIQARMAAAGKARSLLA